MKNEDWDPTGYYTKKLESRRHEPAVVGVCVVAMIIIALVAVFATPANAHPLPTGDKELITTVNGHANKQCKIYRIKIDNQYYIANTCGGIVKE